MMATSDIPTAIGFVTPIDSAVAATFPKLILSREAVQWLGDFVLEADQKPTSRARVSRAGEEAAIGTTPLPIGSLSAGMWRVNYHVRVTQAASGSSDLRVSIHWTDGGIAQTHQGTLVNGNLTTSRDGAAVIVVSDSDTPISYAVSYNSVGATPMQFRIDIAVEELSLG